MKNCPRCGAELSDDTEVCDYCGKVLVEGYVKNDTCPNCGNVLGPDDRFCNRCGSEVKRAPKPSQQEAPNYSNVHLEYKEELKKNMEGSYGIGFLLGFLLALIGLLIAIFAIKKRKTTVGAVFGFALTFTLSMLLQITGVLKVDTEFVMNLLK